ncbi:TetR/AcrR family transcriptional regulator [Ilumatobacter coccineus]|nr:TetR/AcrR family transcriptional regulator [Ilumatobacter coccineus]
MDPAAPSISPSDGRVAGADDIDRRPAAVRGRKRDEDRTGAILEAAQAVLLEHGFDRFRIQDVAAHAGCGTGAIYRRWASKEDLLADAIRTMPDPTVEATDDPVADLHALIVGKLADICSEPDLVSGLVAAMRAHPVIDAAVRSRYTVPVFIGAIGRIIGPDHEHTDLLAELGPALVFHRAIFTPDTLDPHAVADEVIALTLAVRDQGVVSDG